MNLEEYINHWCKPDYTPYPEVIEALKQDGWEDITDTLKKCPESCPVDDPNDEATTCPDRDDCGVMICDKGLVHVFILSNVYVHSYECY